MNAVIVDKGNGYQAVSITGAQIVGYPGSVWRNFKGTPTDNGLKHTFVIEIDEQFVQMLRDLNFSVNYYDKEGRRPFYYLTVSLSWRFRDPKVYVVAYNMVQTQQTEETVADLDQCSNISFIDMEISASHYNSHGREGYTAYGNDVFVYLGAPSYSEQLYMERLKNSAAYQPQLPNMPDPVISADPDDIPF